MKKEIYRVLTPLALSVRESEGGSSRTITGCAILFETPSETLWQTEKEDVREVIGREAITKDFLDEQDIKMTMFHDRELILARSNKGAGTLQYSVNETGVYFSFEAPHTTDGDKAVELVKRGDISGCSFAFSTHYYDPEYVECSKETTDGRTQTTYRVKKMTGVYDFTLAADPAYIATSVEAREKAAGQRQPEQKEPQQQKEPTGVSREYIEAMRKEQRQKIIRK